MDNIYGAYEDEGCFIPSSGTVSPSNPFNSGVACAPCVDGAVFPLVPVVDDSECDNDPDEQLRRLAVNPPDLFFGAISGVEYPREQTAVVRNTGDIPIGIQSVTIINPAFSLVDFIPPSVVNPGSQFNIKIRYYSAYIGQDLGQVVIDTDQDRPPYTIGLSGRVVSNLLDVDFETALATINGAVSLAEQAAQDAITAAIGAGNSGVTAAGYAELSSSYANIATGEAAAAHAQAVAAQSFSTTSGNWATASASSAETAVTKANDAGASAAAAEISRLAAVAANDTATAQAGIATTKAVEANASAASALSSETLSSTYKNQANASAVASAASASLADGYQAVASTNALLSAQFSTGGGNELASSELLFDLTGWTFSQDGTSHEPARNAPDANWHTIGANTLTLHQTNNNSTDQGYFTSDKIPCKPGEYNEVSGLASAHRTDVQILLRYRNYLGALIAGGDFFSQLFSYTEGEPSNLMSLGMFKPLWAKGQAPAGAAFKEYVMIKLGTKTGSDSWAWLCQPQIRKVPDNSTSPAIYSPSSGRGEMIYSNAAIIQAATAAANANAAQAQVRTDLTAAIAGNTATLGIHADTLATLNGKTDSRFVVSAITPGGVAQLSIYSNSDTGAGIELTGNVRINGNLVVDKSITWNQVATSPGQFSNEASAGWSGSYTPIHGETFNIPAVVSLYNVKPSGRFFYELGINFTTNLGVRETISIGGKPAYTDFVASDSGIGVYATDPNGNVYTPINGVNRPILATAAFNAHFVPYVRRGSLEEDYQDMGDYYRRQVAAQYTVTSYFLRVVWTAF